MLTIFMAITLGIIVVVSVVAIVMSTSQGADWSEDLWTSFRRRRESDGE